MRIVSETFRKAINQQETDEVFILLVTISHDEMDDSIRLTSDAVNTISRGNTYYALPFEISLPDDLLERAPQAQFTIDNLHRDFVAAIRGISTPPTVLMEVVLFTSPDVVEVSYPDFKMRAITYDSYTISGALTLEGFVNEKFPAHTFNPSIFPGLFYGDW